MIKISTSPATDSCVECIYDQFYCLRVILKHSLQNFPVRNTKYLQKRSVCRAGLLLWWSHAWASFSRGWAGAVEVVSCWPGW